MAKKSNSAAKIPLTFGPAPSDADFDLIDGLVQKHGNVKVLPVVSAMATLENNSSKCLRLFRAAAEHGHHKLGEFFLARFVELAQ